eukprot:GILJ01005500.1.p1 GENE.GILJ01005500.1~~GILJ01005500.1.p1  ORF type:complete len:322 (-),score=30.16 GILJ01005500.1:99-1064(-)
MGDGYYFEQLRSLASLRRQERSSRHDSAVLSLLDRWAIFNDAENVNKVLAAIPASPPIVKRDILQFLLPPVNRKLAAQQGPRRGEWNENGLFFCLFIPRDNVGVCKFPAVLDSALDEVDDDEERRLFDHYQHDTLLAVSCTVSYEGISAVELLTSDLAMPNKCYRSRATIVAVMCELFPRSRYDWLPSLLDLCRWVLKRQPYAFENNRKGYLCYLSQFLRKHIEPIWHALCDRHERLNTSAVLKSYIVGNDFFDHDPDFICVYEDECEDENFSFVFESCRSTLHTCSHLEGTDTVGWIRLVRLHLFEDLSAAFQAEIDRCR